MCAHLRVLAHVCVLDGAGSLVDSDRSPGKPGFDTLDELAEKHKFFQVSAQLFLHQEF